MVLLVFFWLFFLCAPLCTAKQRKTHRLSLKVSNAYKPFLVLPNMQWLVVQNYLALDRHITKDAYFVLGRVNVSFSNLAVSCLCIWPFASSRLLSHRLFIPSSSHGIVLFGFDISKPVVIRIIFFNPFDSIHYLPVKRTIQVWKMMDLMTRCPCPLTTMIWYAWATFTYQAGILRLAGKVSTM